MKLKTICILGYVCLFHLPGLYSQNNALRFDGSNDYVQLSSQVNVGSSNFTFEAWVKPTATTNGAVFAQDINGNTNHQFRLMVQNTRARFYFTGASASPSIQIATAANIVPTNEWSHLAVVRSGTTVTIYVNGVSEATGTAALINNQSGADATKPFRIGARGATSNANGQNNFTGTIDELRYWNYARTVAQIKANMFNPPSVNSPGLMRFYEFDTGSGTTALNSSTSNPGNNGTLINGPTWVTSPIVYGANSLALDGANDVMSIGSPLATGSSFTKEAYVYATQTSGNLNLISSLGSPFWINNGHLKAGIAGTIEVISDPGTFPTNTWVHVAVTFEDATNTMRLYRDGNLVATNSSLLAIYTGENVYVGSWQGSMSFFEGKIDEVRIWNVARTASQILNNRDIELSPASESNLLSYFTFNQGIVNGSNAGLNTVIDQKGSFNGALSGLALTGSSSNFVSQFASLALLPVRWKEFTAAKKGTEVDLQWKTDGEQNTASFTVQHSSDALSWTDLSAVAAAGESHQERTYQYIHRYPSTGANYYRLLQKDIDGKKSFSEIKKVIFDTSPGSVIIKSNPVVNNTLELIVDKPVTLTIYSMQGNVILKKQLFAGSQRVNVQKLAKGIYVARAGDAVEKIVVR